MKKNIQKTLKLVIYTALLIGIASLIDFIIKDTKKQHKDLNTAIINQQPLSCGDPMRDKPYVYVDNYIANGNIIDKKTNVIWSKNDCRSYYIQG